jgi:DNA helicase-2/ATP-dependent DNA helicase PcrA
MTDPIFDGLNEEQLAAVRALTGPVLIIAGAGSGKTRALTHRIAHLIHQGIPPWQILAVTFTNKAANEMKERIVNLLKLSRPDSKQLPAMGTFHSICVRILRRDIEQLGRSRDFVIYDAEDQETLLKEVLREMRIDLKELKPRTALAHIGSFKCEALSPEEVVAQATTERMARMVTIYKRYQKKLWEHRALDFDDLILETVRLLHETPTVLERYQNTWRYLNVDEYQDTNRAQYLLISLLARKEQNLCVIGDPDQSIYAFRGADIRNILEFESEYPEAMRITLERNYRSTQPILDCADAIIAANPHRPPKKMWTHRADGDRVILQEVADEVREAEEVLQAVLKQHARGVPLNEQVILYRTHAQSRLFEEACLKHGLPYRLVGGVKFYARREVKDVLAYLHVLHNPGNSLALLRILNVPPRKIGKTTVKALQAYCQEKNVSLWDALRESREPTAHGKQRLMSFVSLIEKYQQRKEMIPVAPLTQELLEEIGMEGWLRDETTEGEARWENIGELLSVMQKYSDLQGEQSLLSFLEEVALVSEVDALQEVKDDALTLMTLHLCKGLEFRHVLLTGCEEGLLPHRSAFFDRAQLEEERRLLYVGMTRAKDLLRLSYTRSRLLWGEHAFQEPSRFLEDLPWDTVERRSDDLLSKLLWRSTPSKTMTSAESKPMEPTLELRQDFSFHGEESPRDLSVFRKGARIQHPRFGTGTITMKRGDVVEVHFDSGERKKLALSVAPLQML